MKKGGGRLRTARVLPPVRRRHVEFARVQRCLDHEVFILLGPGSDADKYSDSDLGDLDLGTLV